MVKNLFDKPLAFLLRPKSLDDFFGQDHIVGEGKLLRELINNDALHSVIFYGPPGTGKTTLAYIIAENTKSEFVVLNAKNSGVSDLRKVVDLAKDHKRLGVKTVLFIDEIHCFSKSQQDFLLSYVEDGTIILIGATTENPSFEVNTALLSRSQVFVFKSISYLSLKKVLERALLKISILKNGGLLESENADLLSNIKEYVDIDDEGKDALLNYANGDARVCLNALEAILKFSNKSMLTLSDVQNVIQNKFIRYDRNGEEHYNLISALHKSMRDSDPDSALYWLGRMLEGGENPLYIARRLIRFASEDVGMADPHALLVAVAVKDACHFNGMPECGVNLAQAVVHLSMAPKSDSLYKAYKNVQSDVKKFGNLEIPLHLLNSSSSFVKKISDKRHNSSLNSYSFEEDKQHNSNKNFNNSASDKTVTSKNLPNKLVSKKYYFPTPNGLEAKIKSKLDNLN